MRNIILLFSLITFFQQQSIAQDQMIGQKEKESKKELKNTVRFNATNPVIFGGRSIIFGYERILNKNHSFSINAGRAGFPKLRLRDADSLKTHGGEDQKGLHISADFRFYLSKQNKYGIPRGVYIGPYYSFNYVEQKNSWTIRSTDGGNPQTVETKTNFAATTIGFELGYQFVLWERISLDMILAGPGLGFYKLETVLSNDLSQADETKFYNTLDQALSDRFPGYAILTDSEEYVKKGTVSKTAFGFRYMIMLGYRF
jgi:hypothetical protein